jgi:hypothetical protein
MKHTPGPWTFDGGSIWANTEKIIAVINNINGAERFQPLNNANLDEKFDVVSDANAHLIVAAPDLLAACQAAVDMIGDQRDRLFAEGYDEEHEHIIESYAVQNKIAELIERIGAGNNAAIDAATR